MLDRVYPNPTTRQVLANPELIPQTPKNWTRLGSSKMPSCLKSKVRKLNFIRIFCRDVVLFIVIIDCLCLFHFDLLPIHSHPQTPRLEWNLLNDFNFFQPRWFHHWQSEVRSYTSTTWQPLVKIVVFIALFQWHWTNLLFNPLRTFNVYYNECLEGSPFGAIDSDQISGKSTYLWRVAG